ncbi:MAG: hypothetical protein ABGZ35_31070 [Planctomycetaceae bacterium]
MDLVLRMLVETALVPVIVSGIIVATMIRVPKLAPASGAVALGTAFFAGWATQQWTTLWPTRYLDWLPYVAVGLSVVALMSTAGLPRKIIWPLATAACVGAAWLLVPPFARLQPLAVCMIAAATLLLFVAVEPLRTRSNERLFIACLMATGTAGSIVLAQSFSLKFAQSMGILTAALAGSLLFGKGGSDSSSACLSLVFMTVLTNLMFIGYAGSTSDVPVFCYAILPFAPLALWIAAGVRNKEKRSLSAAAGAVVAFAIVLLVAVGPAVMAHPPWEVE